MVRLVQPWSLIVVGCGTANLACVRALARSESAKGLDRATLIDPAPVRAVNADTCPEYAGRAGEPKVERLAELIGEWFPAARTTRLDRDVEDVDWRNVLELNGAGGAAAKPRVTLIGLDDWGSRLHVVESIRHAAAGSRAILPVQVAVERDQAQVTVFGNRWQDACPGCGLFSLPGNEPCRLLGADGELVRGDLQGEAVAAGELVVQIVADHLAAAGTASSWVGTKTNLHAARPGSRRFERHTRPRVRVESCLGPHCPTTPIRPQFLVSQREPV